MTAAAMANTARFEREVLMISPAQVCFFLSALKISLCVLGTPALAQFPSVEDEVKTRMQYLQSSNVNARIKNATKLGEMGPKAEAAISLLCEILLHDKNVEARKAYLAAIERIAPHFYPHVVTLIVDRDGDNHFASLLWIAKRGQKGYVLSPIVAEHLKVMSRATVLVEDWNERFLAYDLAEPLGVPALARIARADKSALRNAVSAIDERAGRLLSQKGKESLLAACGVIALARISTEDPKYAKLASDFTLNHPNALLRYCGLVSMKIFGTTATAQRGQIEKLKYDRVKQIRELATEVHGSFAVLAANMKIDPLAAQGAANRPPEKLERKEDEPLLRARCFVAEQHAISSATARKKMCGLEEGLCLLSGLRGSFRGYGESVHVGLDDAKNWYLSAVGIQPVFSHAIIVKELPDQIRGFTIEQKQWQNGMKAVELCDLDRGICWLSRVSGDFRGGAEYVEITKRGAKYYLDGGAGHGGAIAASATICRWEKPVIGANLGVREVAWDQYKQNPGEIKLISHGAGFCGLSRVGGGWLGGGETGYVHLKADGNWYLFGHSLASGMNLRVYCFEFLPGHAAKKNQ